MKLPLFKLEDYLSEREFQAEYMFCSSDMETYSVAEIVSMADTESTALWNNLKLNYTEPFGNPILREEIAKVYGPSIAGKNILCFAGAEEGIFCMSHALLDKRYIVPVTTKLLFSGYMVPVTTKLLFSRCAELLLSTFGC